MPLTMDHDNQHICCSLCRIPVQKETELYYCICETIICDVCEKTRTCGGCKQGRGSMKRVYLYFKDEDEQDKAVKEHLEGTYLAGDILVGQHDHLVQEIKMCREVSKRLKRSVDIVQEAAELAKERRVDMIATRSRRTIQLGSLRALVRKKEEELRNLQQKKQVE